MMRDAEYDVASTADYHHSPTAGSAKKNAAGGAAGADGDDSNPFEADADADADGHAADGGRHHGEYSRAAAGSSPSTSAAGRMSSMFSSFSAALPGALSLPTSSETDAYFAHQAHATRSSQLHKVLGWPQLISLGVGCTIGAGIFVVTGVVAATKAGPALFLCYIVSGIACGLAGLCYSELAAMSPSAGSAYSYARASMGQMAGWVIGWDLTLEYAVSGASVAQGWSKYANELLKLMGTSFPDAVSQAPWAYDASTGKITPTGAVLDLPAMLITLGITLLLVRGMRESARFASAMVVLKVGICLLIVIVGSFFVKAKNFEDFMPFGFFGISFFGHTAFGQTGPDGSPVGVFAGAAIVFFAYIGFDTVTCQAEETKNPQRDLPIGIIGSLAISTVLYVSVSLVLVGMVPYQLINIDAPLSDAFGQLGMHWAEFLIALGAIVGITSVLLVTLMGQPRILMSMARDGLLPESFFAAVHPVYGTPYKSTLLTGVVVSILASLVPLSVLVELVSIGTLLAFTMVCVSIIVLRRTAPNVPRPFRCPYVPAIPIAGASVCVLMMLSLPSSNWLRLLLWLGLGMVVYVLYGKKNAERVTLQRRNEQRDRDRDEEIEIEAQRDVRAAGGVGGGGGGAEDDSDSAAARMLMLDPPSRVSFSRNDFEDIADASDEHEHDHEHGLDAEVDVALRHDHTGAATSSASGAVGQGYVSRSAAQREAKTALLDPEEMMLSPDHDHDHESEEALNL